MDREIPKGKTDLYILSAAYKWHPYAARTLPVTSPLPHVWVCAHYVSERCVLVTVESKDERK